MTIKYALDKIGEERGKTIGDFMRETELPRNTIKGIWHNSTVRIDNNTLNTLCQKLRLKPADIIKYIPDEQNEAAGK